MLVAPGSPCPAAPGSGRPAGFRRRSSPRATRRWRSRGGAAADGRLPTILAPIRARLPPIRARRAPIRARWREADSWLWWLDGASLCRLDQIQTDARRLICELCLQHRFVGGKRVIEPPEVEVGGGQREMCPRPSVRGECLLAKPDRLGGMAGLEGPLREPDQLVSRPAVVTA